MKNILSIGFIALTSITIAQTPKKQAFTIQKGCTVNLSAKEDGPWHVNVYNEEADQSLKQVEKEQVALMKQQVRAQFPLKTNESEAPNRSLPVPNINTAFVANGAGNSVPMDNSLAISDSGMILSVSNGSIQVYNELGTLIKTSSLSTFAADLSLTGTNNRKFDPKVIYDPLADRFILVMLNGTNSTYSKIIVGFSETNRPDSTWNLYTLSGNPLNDTTWFDYPAISITEDEVFITGNQLYNNMSWLLGFKQSVIWQVGKAEGYAGAPINSLLWSGIQYNNRPIRNLHAVTAGSAIQGPKTYFLSNRNISSLNDTIFVLNINDTIGAPGIQLDIAEVQSDIPYGFPPNAFQRVAGQYLATNDGRVLGGFYENDNIYFASNSVDTSNGRAGIYFGHITGVDAGNYSVTGQLISEDTLDFGYPNVSWCANGSGTESNQFVSFLHSGQNRYPGISTVFYSDNDWSSITPITEGTAALLVLSDSVERWGDYFGSQTRYNRPGSVWICGTYGTGSNIYKAYVAELWDPLNVFAGNEEPIAQKPQATLYPNPSVDYSKISFVLTQNKNVRVVMHDLNGREVGVLYQGVVYEGLNTVQFNTSHLSAGTYLISVVSENEVLFQEQLVKH